MQKIHGVAMVVAMGLALLVGGEAFAGKLDRTPRQVQGVVNLNTGSQKELELLPGVGPHTAKAIVAYREKTPFKAPGDVVKVKGVGRGIFKRIKDHIAVSGPTTLVASGKAAPASKKSEARAEGGGMKAK